MLPGFIASCSDRSYTAGLRTPRRDRYERYACLREAWIRDLFRLRGDHAHGRIAPRYASICSLREHLLFEALTFQLLVKSRLVREADYNWTDFDLARIEAIEKLLQYDHFAVQESEPPSGEYREPRTWSKSLDRARLDRL